jgi:hypothetical protein
MSTEKKAEEEKKKKAGRPKKYENADERAKSIAFQKKKNSILSKISILEDNQLEELIEEIHKLSKERKEKKD